MVRLGCFSSYSFFFLKLLLLFFFLQHSFKEKQRVVPEDSKQFLKRLQIKIRKEEEGFYAPYKQNKIVFNKNNFV
jgi:hypothetical protein